jgi:glycine hydroxymethyltransferase
VLWHPAWPPAWLGLLATNDDEIAAAFRKSQPTVISSHHFAATAALGLAALEFVLCDGAGYARATVANAKALAEALTARTIPVVGEDFGYTAGHQLWIRTHPLGISSAEAAQRLYEAGIHVNFLNDLPVGEEALRVGLNEATWQGLTSADMPELASIMAAAILSCSAVGQHHGSDSLAGRTQHCAAMPHRRAVSTR